VEDLAITWLALALENEGVLLGWTKVQRVANLVLTARTKKHHLWTLHKTSHNLKAGINVVGFSVTISESAEI